MSERSKKIQCFDVLADVLESLRFRGSIFFRSDLAAPWGISLPDMQGPRFHISISGDCVLGGKGDEIIRIKEMEIVLIPKGTPHWIADRPGRELVPGVLAEEACELGRPMFQNGKITNRLICGIVNYDNRLKHSIFESLPNAIHFRKIGRDEPIWQCVRLIDAEMARNDGLGGASVDRLTEVLFMQLLNKYVAECEGQTGFMLALGDHRLHHALQLIHREPEKDWTLTLLGQEVGMSPSTLVRHFRKSVGSTPMAYIANWRMLKSRNLVRDFRLSLDHIAERVGFTSARSFTRSFQRHYGYSPTELRKTMKAEMKPA